MKHTISALAIICSILCVLTAGCADVNTSKQVGNFGSVTTSPTTPQVTGTTGTGSWTGTWNTNWGLMNLTRSGNTVTGTYAQNAGTITGSISGNTVSGTWSNAPSYQPPNDAGDIILTLSADGKSLTGKFRHGSTGDWITTLSGTRVGQQRRVYA